MEEIINKLLYGMNGDIELKNNSEEYRKICEEFAEKEKEFKNSLSGETAKRYQAFMDVFEEKNSMENEFYYTCGFKRGVQMIIDAYFNKEK